MATIFYARVSTSEQTVGHHRTQAEAASFVFDQVVIDEGVSGVTTKLAERPGGRRVSGLVQRFLSLVEEVRLWRFKNSDEKIRGGGLHYVTRRLIS